jgi:hypothetical protein
VSAREDQGETKSNTGRWTEGITSGQTRMRASREDSVRRRDTRRVGEHPRRRNNKRQDHAAGRAVL